MARIRTIKPEFFEDEDIGMLCREARLLFIASWGLADDEGLLRWTAPYLKAGAFLYDDDINVDDVERYMGELVDNGFVFPYRGGRSQQRLGWIVNFRKHQRINRPSPPKLPAPSLQSPEVREAYFRRDNWECAICGNEVEVDPVERAGATKGQPSLDHITPKSEGGTDYPSNVRLAHRGCNSARGAKNRDPSEYAVKGAMSGSPGKDARVMSDSVSDSVSRSTPEREREGEGERKGRESSGVSPSDAPLSHLLADLVAENDPNHKRPNITKAWAVEEDRLIRLDGRRREEAERLIRWTQADAFWRGNVMSMPKFRQRYGQLYQAAVEDSQKRNGRPPAVTRPELSKYDRVTEEVAV